MTQNHTTLLIPFFDLKNMVYLISEILELLTSNHEQSNNVLISEAIVRRCHEIQYSVNEYEYIISTRLTMVIQ